MPTSKQIVRLIHHPSHDIATGTYWLLGVDPRMQNTEKMDLKDIWIKKIPISRKIRKEIAVDIAILNGLSEYEAWGDYLKYLPEVEEFAWVKI
jgi:hypothetical protein